MSTTNIPCINIILRHKHKLAFLLRTHTCYKDEIYTLPAGHVEDDESYQASAVREAKEKTGVTIESTSLRHVFTLQRKEDKNRIRVDIFFEATAWSGQATNTEPEKHGELTWFDANNLPNDKIMDYRADILQKIAMGKPTPNAVGKLISLVFVFSLQ